MTELQQNRYDQLLRRVGDLKGPGSKVNDVLTELFPVIDVERIPGELLALGGTALCMGAATLSGAVGERARVQLFNPVGSGKLIAVSAFFTSSNSSQTYHWARSIIALPTGVGTEVFRDSRFPTASRPTGQIRTDSQVAIVDANGIFRIGTNVTFPVQDENSVAVLSPGAGLEVGAVNVVTLINVTFFWRERVAQPSELSF